jgi:hypothetical protein
MNLGEGVCACADEKGLLILSRFTGAAAGFRTRWSTPTTRSELPARPQASRDVRRDPS